MFFFFFDKRNFFVLDMRDGRLVLDVWRSNKVEVKIWILSGVGPFLIWVWAHSEKEESEGANKNVEQLGVTSPHK